MREKPSMFNLIRIAIEQEMTAEELIAIADKNDDCALSKDELIGFLEKWAKKKNMKLT